MKMSKKQTAEDVFYENLTLGLTRTLSNVPRICDVFIEKRQPCEKAQLVTWEQRHCVYLPEDMKKFYLSTDGFILNWSYQYAPNDVRRVGTIHFPHLLQITLLRENIEFSPTVSSMNMDQQAGTSRASIIAATATMGAVTTLTKATHGATAIIGKTEIPTTSKAAEISAPTSTMQTLKTTTSLKHANNVNDSSSTQSTHSIQVNSIQSLTITPVSSQTNCVVYKDIWGNPLPHLTAKSKIFELNNINDMAKVVLIYETTQTTAPKFFLLELNSMRLQFLSDTFSEYLRMSIAHLGLPYWELCFASFGLPSWTEQLFLLLAPHLLGEHENRRNRIIHPANETPYNVIDPNVFRTKPKPISKIGHLSKHKI